VACTSKRHDTISVLPRHTVLEHYLFHTRSGDMLLALGIGSIFNHARKPNVDYRVDSVRQV
jgi:hypothetical protein